MGSFLLTPTSREEVDAWDGRWDGSAKSLDSSSGDINWIWFIFAGITWADHVWFEEDTLEEDVLVIKSLEGGGEDLLGDALGSFDAVVTIWEDFWLNNWADTVLLADGGIASEGPGDFTDGELTWEVSGDFDDVSPFGETEAQGIVLFATFGEVIKTKGGLFTLSSWNILETFVEFNSCDNVLGLEKFNEVLAIFGGLLDGFFVEDDTGNGFLEVWGGEKEFTVSATVLLVVLEIDGGEFLADGTCALISSEDTEAWSSDGLGGGNQFS